MSREYLQIEKIATKLPPTIDKARMLIGFFILTNILVLIFYGTILLQQYLQTELFMETLGIFLAVMIIQLPFSGYYIKYTSFNIKKFYQHTKGLLLLLLPCFLIAFRIQFVTLTFILVEMAILYENKIDIFNLETINNILMYLTNLVLLGFSLHLDKILFLHKMVLAFPALALFMLCLLVAGLHLYLLITSKQSTLKMKTKLCWQLFSIVSFCFTLSPPIFWGYLTQNIIPALSVSVIYLSLFIYVLIIYRQQLALLRCYNFDDDQRQKHKIIYRLSQNWFSQTQPLKQSLIKLRQINFFPQYCCICTTNPANSIWFPCGHNNLCFDCSNKLYKREKQKCTLCKTQFKKIIVFDLDEQQKGIYLNLKLKMSGSLQNYEYRVTSFYYKRQEPK